MLLEVLSEFQIDPRAGDDGGGHPAARTADLQQHARVTEALKRRCLYLWLDYPDASASSRSCGCTCPTWPALIESRTWSATLAAVDRGVDRLGQGTDPARRGRHRPRRVRAHDLDPVKHRRHDLVAERVGIEVSRVSCPSQDRRNAAAPRRAPGRAGRPARGRHRRLRTAAEPFLRRAAQRRRAGRDGGDARRLFGAVASQLDQPRGLQGALAATSRRRTAACSSCCSTASSSVGRRRRSKRAQGGALRGGERVDLDDLRQQIQDAIRQGCDGVATLPDRILDLAAQVLEVDALATLEALFLEPLLDGLEPRPRGRRSGRTAARRSAGPPATSASVAASVSLKSSRSSS